MSTRRGRLTSRRMETWLWTGPLGHFVGGAFDLAEALARHGLARVWSAIRPALARSPSR